MQKHFSMLFVRNVTMDIDYSKVTEVELIYRNTMRPSERLKITRPVNAYKLFHSTWDMDRIEFVEQFKVMLLNRSGRVLGISEISSGGMNCVCVDLRLVFATALKAAASSIICCHNHPSGSLAISSQDMMLTEKLRQAGKLLDIAVDDHIILTGEGYVSFAEEGML